MSKDHSAFLAYVRDYVQESPEVAAYVSDHVARGIDASRQQALNRASDMEVALSIALAKKWKNGDAIILGKLKTWAGRSSISWDATIKLMEATKEKKT